MRFRVKSSIALAAVGFVPCDAFAPSQKPITRAADATSIRQGSLLSRNAFFGGLFETGEEKTASAGVFSSSKSNDLIETAKDYVDNKSGFFSDYDADAYAEDFVFRGPLVGPLNKKDYLKTMEAFGIWKAIPDIKANSWGYSIDPEDPNRVWFMVRSTGTFDGDPIKNRFLNIQPNGAEFQGPPETFSIVFDEEKKMKYLTVGYVADRFDGNTDGDGAAFAVFNIAGSPLPKFGPLLRFSQWLVTEVPPSDWYPKSWSKDLPDWYLEEKGNAKGCDGTY